ncbi:MAG: tRNA epoxyqueuosine(34) reductase QueG [Anaerolineales bacterium]|nr:tRNA epoxyqueuosine(34) reductase QueG [Anaerolineales bacterium]MDW8161403.1 tRNA epoxyqueuosine(34) reductase QueG [Anaerolineales bacterium]
MEATKLAQEIKSLALELGFAAVGITTPEPPPHLEVYFRWLERGYHGEMGYMAEPHAVYLRSNPAELLRSCQSVIVLAARYSAPGPYLPSLSRGKEERGAYGRVAAYAWGEDYHYVLRQRMEILVQRIQEKLGRSITYRCFTDSAPILERELAQRAGLGWIGKNTCLIHPRLGSFLFLAEIFTDLPLPPDKPFLPDRCGTCQRCIQACPTQCILPNRTLDARRCISYLTIEHRTAIPVELRTLLGDWVFGCDICQQVCPWNRRISPAPSFPEFLPQTEREWLSLSDILSMSQVEFKQKFRHSPLLRAMWRGLSRNSAVVLGNLARLGEISRLAALELLQKKLSNHPEGLVRQHLAWSLTQLNSDLVSQTLREHIQQETEPMVRAEIEAWLTQNNPS